MKRNSTWGALLRLALISAFALLAATNVGSAAGESFELLPRWKKGESVRYEMVKSREQARPGKETLKTTNRTDLDIEVLNASEDAFVLAWTLGETRFDDPAQDKNPIVQKVVNLLKGYRIVLELDSQAGIQGVQNWQELKEASTKLLDTLSNELKATGIDPAMVAKTRAEAQSMFGSKQQIEQLGTKDAQLFFMPLGIEFEGGKPVEFDDKLANPFGGEPFPSKVRFRLKEVDRKRGVAKLRWTQTVASDDARRIMEKTLKDFAQRLGKPVADADLLKTLTIEDSADFAIEISSGWIQNFTHKRVTKTEGSSRADVVMVSRKKE